MLNDKELLLAPNDTVTLIATVQPDDATNKTITWTSSNPAVATVTGNGLVTAIADGKTTITATAQDGGKKATCEVTVDYRSQWVGEWDFEVDHFWYLYAEGSGHNTFYYIGNISYVPTDNELYIEYSEYRKILATVSRNGELLLKEGSFCFGKGQFEGKDRINFQFGEESNGGGFTDTVIGTKKEGGKK